MDNRQPGRPCEWNSQAILILNFQSTGMASGGIQYYVLAPIVVALLDSTLSFLTTLQQQQTTSNE
jgi:hypothetical protein